MKTKDEILLFLVRNSTPEYHDFPVSTGTRHRSKGERLNTLLLRLSGTTRYKCPTEKLEAFLGEPVSFERHLRPLYEEGTLYFSGIPKPGDLYDSPSYRENFDASQGQVKDYSTGQSWVAFWYRENDFLKHNEQIMEDAEALGLFGKP